MDRDTLFLLGDCTAGIAMTVAAMDGVLPNVKDQVLRRRLQDSIRAQEALREQSCRLLHQWGGTEKQPSAMAKNMAILRNSTRLALHKDDPTAADVVANSCDRQIRELCRSRNRYAGADPEAQFLADRVIASQEQLSAGLRNFL